MNLHRRQTHRRGRRDATTGFTERAPRGLRGQPGPVSALTNFGSSPYVAVDDVVYRGFDTNWSEVHIPAAGDIDAVSVLSDDVSEQYIAIGADFYVRSTTAWDPDLGSAPGTVAGYVVTEAGRYIVVNDH